MIHDKLGNARTYAGLGPAFARALAWLGGQDLPSLAEGRIDIEGDAKIDGRDDRSFVGNVQTNTIGTGGVSTTVSGDRV